MKSTRIECTGGNATYLKKIHWKCSSRKPYFGLVKRAMNRAPSPRDPWWAQHERDFGGQYTNIKEPPPPPPKAEKQPEAKKFKRESNQPAFKRYAIH
ncbi:hypothetical protein Ae201684P_012742 [Aphanomyces euteiches]|nr:hypothetical protein Ae201684P_012742 [Aphanomyces euteiches]